MNITNKGQTWTHTQAIDAVSGTLQGVVGVLAAEQPKNQKAAAAVAIVADMANTLAGLSAGIDALETLVAELRAQLDAATRVPAGMAVATVRRTLRDADNHLLDAIVERQELVPVGIFAPLV